MNLIHLSTVLVVSGSKKGSGFLVRGGYLVTAAHNLNPGSIHRFYICDLFSKEYSPSEEHLSLEVEKLIISTKVDLAIFRVTSQLEPERLLAVAPAAGSNGKSFYTSGFPDKNVMTAEVWSGGIINHITKDKIDFHNPDIVSEGYSGGPIYDTEKNAVIGVVLSKHNDRALVRGVPTSILFETFKAHHSAFDLSQISKPIWKEDTKIRKAFVIHPFDEDGNKTNGFKTLKDGFADNSEKEFQIELLSWQNPSIKNSKENLLQAISKADCILITITEEGDHDQSIEKLADIIDAVKKHSKIYVLNIDSDYGKITRYVDQIEYFTFLIKEEISQFFFEKESFGSFPSLDHPPKASKQKIYFPAYLSLKTKLGDASGVKSVETALLTFDFVRQKGSFNFWKYDEYDDDYDEKTPKYLFLIHGPQKAGHELLAKQILLKELLIENKDLAKYRVNLSDVTTSAGITMALFKHVLNKQEKVDTDQAYIDLKRHFEQGKAYTTIIFHDYSLDQLSEKQVALFGKEFYARLEGLSKGLILFFLDQGRSEEAVKNKPDLKKGMEEELGPFAKMIILPHLGSLGSKEWKSWIKSPIPLTEGEKAKLEYADAIGKPIEEAVAEVYKQIREYKVREYTKSIEI